METRVERVTSLPNRKHFVIATTIVIAIILYGSLYPFIFRQSIGGLGSAMRTLIDSWAEPPSRSDLMANILLYIPFGFCAVPALGDRTGLTGRIVLVTVCGALLSTSMELAQYFDQGRVTTASDVYTNAAGAFFGAIGGSIGAKKIRWRLLAEIAGARIPILLLAAWIGYRLFPYVPTIDLHKYWDALKPVILHPSLTGYDLFRYTAIWLTVGALIEAIVGLRRTALLFPLFIAGVLAGKVMIVDATLSVAEIAGAACAIVCRGLLGFNAAFQNRLIALAFCGYVIAERLEPFMFRTTPGPFGWTPFWGFMSGDLTIDVMSFLQKFFLYGSAIWLLVGAGLRLGLATLTTAAMLLITSEAERFLPNRSAEITDALMALLIGTIFALIGSRPHAMRGAVGADRGKGWRRPADWPH